MDDIYMNKTTVFEWVTKQAWQKENENVNIFAKKISCLANIVMSPLNVVRVYILVVVFFICMLVGSQTIKNKIEIIYWNLHLLNGMLFHFGRFEFGMAVPRRICSCVCRHESDWFNEWMNNKYNNITRMTHTTFCIRNGCE